MDVKLKQIISLFCVLVISGLAAANCGKCGSGDKKACPADCQKVCCQKADAQKACPADCQKSCCQKTDAEKKACPADCQKDCCKNRVAPVFTLKDLNGKEVQLGKLTKKGKIVVLEWFNYDCPFVKDHYAAEKNTVGKLAKKYKDKDVVWLTINSTQTATAETTKDWAEKNGVKQTILMDSEGKVGKLYQAKTTPHLFVIDKEGKIVYQGAIDNAPLGKALEGKEKINYVDQVLTELLAGKEITTPKTKPYGCSVKYPKNTENAESQKSA